MTVCIGTHCLCVCVSLCVSVCVRCRLHRGRWWAGVSVKASFGMQRLRYLFGRPSTGLCSRCDNTGPAQETGLGSQGKFCNQFDALSEQRLRELKWGNSGQIMRLTSVTQRMWFPWTRGRERRKAHYPYRPSREARYKYYAYFVSLSSEIS